MKTSYYLFALLSLLCLSQVQSQDAPILKGAIGDEDWTKNWTSFMPNGNHYMAYTMSIPLLIDKDLTLSNKNTYLLSGTVYVVNKATLTIEPGTVIRGEVETCGTLVITKGCKLMALGTERDPIVFTSNKAVGERKPGDWGGIILLGDAINNHIGGINAIDCGLDTKYTQYGGTNDDDNSGILHYVRIEYPGNKLKIDEEFNGLTLAGVGKNTSIENVQISYSNDDSYELYGGSVALKKIISYKCNDDDFDFNYGYQGKVEYGIALRNPLIGDFSGSRCFEIDSYNADKKGFDPSKRISKIMASNFTLIQYDINGNNQTSFSNEALQIGNDCDVSLINSVVSGFNAVYKIKSTSFKESVLKDNSQIYNNTFNGFQNVFTGNNAEELKVQLEKDPLKNMYLNADIADLFIDLNNRVYPNFKFKNPNPTILSNK